MASEKTPVLVGVEITDEMVKEILGLPENVVVCDDLFKNKGLMRRFVLKYMYLFDALARSRWKPAIGTWAMAYKAKKNGGYGLPYGDVYPEALPILYLAWGFGLVKIKPTLYETSMMPIDITLKGARVFIKVVRDVKKGRPVDYPVGHLETYEDVDREWHKTMDPILEDIEKRATQKATEELYRDRFYNYW